jgi:hypothetical protein
MESLKIANKIEISYNNLNLNNLDDKKLINEIELLLEKYGYKYSDNYDDESSTKFYIKEMR